VVKLVREGLRAGAALALLLVGTWVCMVASRSTEPAAFLDSVYKPRADVSETDLGQVGMFDLRACADCPGFILFNRGFAGPDEFPGTILPVLWSYPALYAASRPTLMIGVRDVQPMWFLVALVAEGLLIGLATRTGCVAYGAIGRVWWLPRGRRTRG
jgi:hypothetical protein